MQEMITTIWQRNTAYFHKATESPSQLKASLKDLPLSKLIKATSLALEQILWLTEVWSHSLSQRLKPHVIIITCSPNNSIPFFYFTSLHCKRDYLTSGQKRILVYSHYPLGSTEAERMYVLPVQGASSMKNAIFPKSWRCCLIPSITARPLVLDVLN